MSTLDPQPTTASESRPERDIEEDVETPSALPPSWVRFAPKIDTRASDWKPDDDHWQDELEPRIAALIQAEHVSLLVGSGLTTAIGYAVGASTQGMARAELTSPLAPAIAKAADASANRMGRGAANIEDDIRAIRQLLDGLEVAASAAGEDRPGDGKDSATETPILSFADSARSYCDELSQELDSLLTNFAKNILAAERGIRAGLVPIEADGEPLQKANTARRLLGSFLLTFASRAASRERLHIFTTNYDRLLEFACDLAGVHVLDRFVGSIEPVFRSSRLGLDLHYNPPGIRGEPRYVEGVVRLTKLHGSLDWRFQDGPWGRRDVARVALPFGADESHPAVGPYGGSIMIYPNAAKDVETLEYPYADLFRDFAAAACQPNGVVVTYGYGFGDDHINRVLRDMLTLPSTHLLIIAFDDTDGRITTFDESVGRPAQVSIMVGSDVASLDKLVGRFLPKPAIDRITWRLAELLERRGTVRRGLATPDKTTGRPIEEGDGT